MHSESVCLLCSAQVNTANFSLLPSTSITLNWRPFRTEYASLCYVPPTMMLYRRKRVRFYRLLNVRWESTPTGMKFLTRETYLGTYLHGRLLVQRSAAPRGALKMLPILAIYNILTFCSDASADDGRSVALCYRAWYSGFDVIVFWCARDFLLSVDNGRDFGAGGGMQNVARSGRNVPTTHGMVCSKWIRMVFFCKLNWVMEYNLCLCYCFHSVILH